MLVARFFQPLAPVAGLAASLILVFGLTLYCLAYNWAIGRPETIVNALLWPVENLVPFYFAFEVAKRQPRWPMRVGLVAIAIVASLGLAFLVDREAHFGFEIVRRVPTAVAVAAALVLSDWLATMGQPRHRQSCGGLPLSPAQIDFVRAAGNYVELHGANRVILHRATLASVAGALGDRGFVRIHRSTLIRAEMVARWRADCVEMRDGSLLQIGARYRGELPADALSR